MLNRRVLVKVFDDPNFYHFLERQKILIVDPNSTSRLSFVKILVGLGADGKKIRMARTFHLALESIRDFMPHFVIAEFQLGERSGLELAALQREARLGDRLNCSFILITSNPTQTSVALAAEEEVDSFIVKPFNQDTVREMLARLIFTKMHPSKYLITIEEGKAAQRENQFEESVAHFNSAIRLSPCPSLACFYLGELYLAIQKLKEAELAYQKGLKFNPIHYKCTIGLLNLYMMIERYEDAYKVIRKIADHFPATPQRLAEALKLAVMTSHFDDVEKLYTAFCAMDERDENLIKHVCAALIIGARYSLNLGDKFRARNCLQKAAVTAGGRVKILRDIVEAWIHGGEWKEALNVLKRFPAESHKGRDFLISRLQILNAEGSIESTISLGRQLIRLELAEKLVYVILIERYLELGLQMSAQELAYDAIDKFPESRVELDRLVHRSHEL